MLAITHARMDSCLYWFGGLSDSSAMNRNPLNCHRTRLSYNDVASVQPVLCSNYSVLTPPLNVSCYSKLLASIEKNCFDSLDAGYSFRNGQLSYYSCHKPWDHSMKRLESRYFNVFQSSWAILNTVWPILLNVTQYNSILVVYSVSVYRTAAGGVTNSIRLKYLNRCIERQKLAYRKYVEWPFVVGCYQAW